MVAETLIKLYFCFRRGTSFGWRFQAPVVGDWEPHVTDKVKQLTHYLQYMERLYWRWHSDPSMGFPAKWSATWSVTLCPNLRHRIFNLNSLFEDGWQRDWLYYRCLQMLRQEGMDLCSVWILFKLLCGPCALLPGAISEFIPNNSVLDGPKCSCRFVS